MAVGGRKRHEAAITIGEFFFYVCSFSLPSGLAASRVLSFFFARENSSTDLSSENDAKRTGRRGFGDPSGRIAALVHGMYSADLGLLG